MRLVFIYLLSAAALVPLLGAIYLGVFSGLSERSAYLISAGIFILHHVLSVVLVSLWVCGAFLPQEIVVCELYRQESYFLPVVFFIDGSSICFLLLTTILTGLVFRFSRYYLHRDPKYVTYFGRVLMFLSGMTIVVTAGTFDQLFAGWELVGLSSFLLIAFYQERIQPVRNAIRIYSIYRLCDVGILLGALMAHILWSETQRFGILLSHPIDIHLQARGFVSVLALGMLILLAACGKSAQFPFTFWLPRSMEGPTPSSAIFYGALSVHLGVFLLIRTFPIWSSNLTVRVCVGGVGVLTSILSTMMGHSQSDIKGQIAYASAAQVGLMFLELSVGLPMLALFHATSNACLRCYQLLASPSVIAYKLRLQSSVSHVVKRPNWYLDKILPEKIRINLYVMTLNEGYLEALVREILIVPLRVVGGFFQKYHLVFARGVLPGMVVLLVLNFSGVFVSPAVVLEILLSGCLLGSSAMAFCETRSAYRSWNLVTMSSLGNVLLLVLAEPSAAFSTEIYWVGLVCCWLSGILAFRSLLGEHPRHPIKYFLGRGRRQHWAGLVLLFSLIGLSGFPNTPVFIGEDFLLFHLTRDHKWLAFVVSMGFVINGVTLFRLFARVCFGPQREVLIRNGDGGIYPPQIISRPIFGTRVRKSVP